MSRPASGHLYFSLKDEREDAVIDCVCYRLEALRARAVLSEGARVQVLGRATVWAPRGRLQFVVQRARPAGRGALLEARERLKERLLAEGLFAPERKRPLPRSPVVIGVVTSAHGAAFQDVVRVALGRARVRIVLSAAQVQGEGAIESLLGALDRIERLPELEVLIVGRGGGAAEDLAAFDDERLVRRLAATRVPLVSAVGHETDVTLADLVADVRAATPSHAAELVVPDRAQQQRHLDGARRALARAASARVSRARAALAGITERLPDPRLQIADRSQWLAERRRDLEEAVARTIALARTRVRRDERRLLGAHPSRRLGRHRAALAELTRRLGGTPAPRLGRLQASLQAARRRAVEAMRARLNQRRLRVTELLARLSALSPLAVLARGYSIVLDEQGRAVTRAASVARDDRLRVRLHEGELTTRVIDRRGPE